MSKPPKILLIAGLALVGALSTYTYLAKQASWDSSTNKWYTQNQVNQGQVLFADHCAACHGVTGQGANNWTQPNAIGVRPAPPLNGSGHAWHHSLADLAQTVENGRGLMPAWKGTLSEAEIIATIAWTQSLWPDVIYTAWSKANP